MTQGQTGSVMINGSGFQSGITASDLVFSSTGVTVNSLTYNGPNSLTANITIAGGAPAGTQDLTANNPDGGTSTAVNIFSVNLAGVTPPSILSASPDSGEQGQTLDVTITGSNFHAAPAVLFGDGGITTNSATFVSSTQIIANITISATAATTSRTITVTNTDDLGVGSLSDAFLVRAAGILNPTVGSIVPGFGYPGRNKIFHYRRGLSKWCNRLLYRFNRCLKRPCL